MADLTALMQEISPDNPCGDYLEYDPAYLELGKLILGKPEDPISGEKAQPPSWRDVQKQALNLLAQSKDLQVVIYLIRALINLEGISGFRDGLMLLQGLLETYWEPIHPVLDPDDDLDPTARVNILEELGNFDSVLWPLTVAPLVESKAAGRFSLRDYQIAIDKVEVPEGTTKPDLSIIKAAFLSLSPDELAANYQALNDCMSCIQGVESVVASKVGIENAPDLSALTALLKELRYAFEKCAEGRLVGDVPAPEEQHERVEDAGIVTSAELRPQSGFSSIRSRQDVLKVLDLICQYYAEYEPSSPVPVLLRRAKYLVTSDFMQIVQNLMPDGLAQFELIKGPELDNE